MPMNVRWISLLTVVALFMLAGGCSSTPEKPDEGPAAGPSGSDAQSGKAGGPSEAAEGETVTKYDLNHDKKPDVWAYHGELADPQNPGKTKKGIIRKEWDLNFDGKIDIKQFFDYKGRLVKDWIDFDFDGIFDAITYYKDGKKVRQEINYDTDEQPECFKYFEKGKLVRVERDRDSNGKIDQWEYYKDGKLDRIGKDEDGDGEIDKWVQQEQ